MPDPTEPLPPDVRAYLAAAGRKGMAKRWGANKDDTQEQPITNTTTKPKKDLPADRAASLADYDALLGQPATWAEAIKREQVQAEILANETRAEEADVRRRSLFTRDQILARDRAFADALLTQLATLNEAIAPMVAPDRRAELHTACKAWIAKVRDAMAQAVKA